jgi:hypothetical protein
MRKRPYLQQRQQGRMTDMNIQLNYKRGGVRERVTGQGAGLKKLWRK